MSLTPRFGAGTTGAPPSTQFAFCDPNTPQTPGSGGIFTDAYQLDGVCNGHCYREYEVYFATVARAAPSGARGLRLSPLSDDQHLASRDGPERRRPGRPGSATGSPTTTGAACPPCSGPA
jgi:hypothetical protein